MAGLPIVDLDHHTRTTSKWQSRTKQGTQMPLNPDDAEQLRYLIHELSEALTAANAHLFASQRYEGSDLREAIGKAIEQTTRAGDVVERLRFVVSGV